MKTAVLYARYSSHSQREVSIEDQLSVCYEYCAREGVDVVNVYHDSAMTGTNDRRPDFQRMISNAPESDYVVVYMMERFSRDKYDAPIYKQQLERKGVRVLSALEFIPDTPEGVMIEKLIEGQAAYYSLKLSRDVIRGMSGNAKKCMANGYRVFGYRIDQETGCYVINDEESAIIREVFARYISGETMNAIGVNLAARGLKTRFGNPVGYNFINTMIHNDKYIGVYRWRDIEIIDGIPAIVDRATFDTAQKAPRRKVRKMEEWDDFPLTGKLYCAICGHPLHGQSARNHQGRKYLYYACKRGSCDRKPIRKEVLEDSIIAELSKVGDEATARKIARAVIAQTPDGGANALKACEAKLKKNTKARSKIVDAIADDAISNEDAKAKMEQLRREQEHLEGELGALKAEDMGLEEDSLTEFLSMCFNTSDSEILLSGMLNRVFLFDGYMVATLNFREETNELAEIEIALDELGFDREQSPVDGSLPSTRMAEPINLQANYKAFAIRNGIAVIVPFAA